MCQFQWRDFRSQLLPWFGSSGADLWLKKPHPLLCLSWIWCCEAGADIQFQELPAWDAFDRHVLRFTGYFKAGMSDVGCRWYKCYDCYEWTWQESVVETNLENYRALEGNSGDFFFFVVVVVVVVVVLFWRRKSFSKEDFVLSDVFWLFWCLITKVCARWPSTTTWRMTPARFRSPKWITVACPKARCGCSYVRPTDPMAQRCTPGQLIRRHRFPSGDGGYLKCEDWKSCG